MVAARLDADDGSIPNSPLPALIERQALDAPGKTEHAGSPAEALASAFEHLFERHGWTGSWRNGVFAYHHYHSTAHEVLGVAAGTARLWLGGEHGGVIDVEAGDVLVLPAGLGHKLEQGSHDFLVVGAYADGRSWDLCPADPSIIERSRRNIALVPLPDLDPVHGAEGGITRHWQER